MRTLFWLVSFEALYQVMVLGRFGGEDTFERRAFFAEANLMETYL